MSLNLKKWIFRSPFNPCEITENPRKHSVEVEAQDMRIRLPQNFPVELIRAMQGNMSHGSSGEKRLKPLLPRVNFVYLRNINTSNADEH